MTFEVTPVFSTTLTRTGSVLTRPVLNGTDRASEACIKYLENSPCERLLVVMLTTQLQVIGVCEITVGTLDASLVHPREVFRPAIIANSSVIILAHNHPSGHLTPSREDIAVFDRLKVAGDFLGIRVLDSIICNESSALSMASHSTFTI